MGSAQAWLIIRDQPAQNSASFPDNPTKGPVTAGPQEASRAQIQAPVTPACSFAAGFTALCQAILLPFCDMVTERSACRIDLRFEAFCRTLL
jgi:hypothetical protein